MRPTHEASLAFTSQWLVGPETETAAIASAPVMIGAATQVIPSVDSSRSTATPACWIRWSSATMRPDSVIE